jgi:ribosome-binding factor A
MTESQRVRRVAEEIREILAEEIPRLKDPRLGFVTVTDVRMTPDLHKAWVFYTVLGDDKAKTGTRAGLRSARSHLRGIVGHEIRLRTVPDLEFEEDRLMEQAARVDELLKEARAGGEEVGDER